MTSKMRPGQTVATVGWSAAERPLGCRDTHMLHFLLKGAVSVGTEEKGELETQRDMEEKPFPNSDPELLSLTKQPASWISAGGGLPSLLLQWTSGNLSNTLGRKYGQVKADCEMCSDVPQVL